MTTETYIADLEKDWLAAESLADELKQEAERIDAELRGHGSEGHNGNSDVKILLSKSEDVQARHAEADRVASEAFDRLWTARNTVPTVSSEQRAAS
ncbi:MAG: hypothetical protein KKB37_11975 [Alphaproteobacteria bacterium]|nr:hypothetical protein [Alphaproteobacteria bacterium]